MLESARSNSAAQKTPHKCCVAALCTNRSDNRKDRTFHTFLKDSQRRMEWAVKMKRSDSKFKSNTSLFCCSENFVSTDYKRSLTGKRKDLLLLLHGFSGPKRQVMRSKGQSDAKEERRNRQSHTRLHVQRKKVIHWKPAK